jgi:CHASE3 domain sensor protein
VTHPRRLLGTLRSQVQLLVGALLVLLLVSAFGTFIVQQQVTDTQAKLRVTFRPAQVAIAKLAEAYDDQETGARGYQLTADKQFLQPYQAGKAMAAQLSAQLAKQVAGDPVARRLLGRVDQAAAAWRASALTPEVAQPQALPPKSALHQQELAGKVLFDTLRSRLSDLGTRLNLLAADEVSQINSAQSIDNVLTIGVGLLGLLLAFVAASMLRNSLARPLTSLVTQVKTVAEGDLGHQVVVTGPAELAIVGAAVETMRVRILAQTTRTMEMQRQLDLTEESERIASGLQDLVIRRLSGTGLALQSAASRHPAATAALSAAVDEIDKAIRELRAVVFGLTAGRASGGLRKRVLNLVSESEQSLGFTPLLQFGGLSSGGVTGTASDGLITALRDILSDIARLPGASEAEIRVDVSAGNLRLRVSDNRPPPASQLARNGGSLAAQAQQLGGTCTVDSRPEGGTTIEWVVPADDAESTQAPAAPHTVSADQGAPDGPATSRQ